MKLYLGTSGYQYKDWAKDFYPAEVKQKDWLGYYASQFNSVEINNSFYRLPTAKTMVKWRDEVPANFVFALKGSRYITHLIRLKDPVEHIDKLFSVAVELGDKLGVVLWQLPANFHQDLDRLEQFAGALNAHKLGKKIPQAIELRHNSWFNDATYDLLRRFDMALVVNQSSRWPVEVITTASWGYWRFHGPKQLYSSGYSDRELSDWAAKARALKSSKLFAYFNNDNGNFAPRNAQTFRSYLNR